MRRRPLSLEELRSREKLRPEDLQQISWLRTARAIRVAQSPEARITQDIGAYVRAYREAYKMTQKEFGIRCGMKQSYIGAIETGRIRQVSLKNAVRLALACASRLRVYLEPIKGTFH